MLTFVIAHVNAVGVDPVERNTNDDQRDREPIRKLKAIRRVLRAARLRDTQRTKLNTVL